MDISKTSFKEYAKCERIYPLTEIYRKKLNQKVNLFDDNRNDDILEILSRFFDSETGEDLIAVRDSEIEAMLPFYKDVERVALENAKEIFKKDFEYFENTSDQKKFSFTDENGYNFYCYLDGYYEDENEIIVIEVKSISSTKINNFGPTIGKVHPIFKKENNIYKLINISDWKYDSKKYQKYYEKLFDRNDGLGKYVFDLAIERYIIERSLKKENNNKKVSYYLAILNSNFYMGKDCRYYCPNQEEESVINYIDLTEVTEKYLEKIDYIKDKIVKNISENKLLSPVIKPECEISGKKHCEFFGVCFKELLEKNSILDYMEGKFFYGENNCVYRIKDMIEKGYKTIESVPRSWIKNPNQLIQRDCYESGKEYINKEKIVAGLKEIKYPIYHLDFEAFNCPLPRFFMEKPFFQSVFQFSIHIETSDGVCDIKKDNVSFVANTFGDQREELVKKLVETINLSHGGTVLVYNKAFEYNRICEFIKIFPKYKEKLELMLTHMIDLEDIIHKGSKFYEKIGFNEDELDKINFYDNYQRGKYSIKKLLPVFSDLSYSSLNIKNGVAALCSYAKFRYLDKEKIEEIRRDLIEYCGQDTWSMVVILRGLKEKIKNI